MAMRFVAPRRVAHPDRQATTGPGPEGTFGPGEGGCSRPECEVVARTCGRQRGVKAAPVSSDSNTMTVRTPSAGTATADAPSPVEIRCATCAAAGEDLTARDRWMGALEAIAAAQAGLTQLTRQAVIAARSRGATWQQVADALGFNSDQDAEFCYGIERSLPRCRAR